MVIAVPNPHFPPDEGAHALAAATRAGVEALDAAVVEGAYSQKRM